MSELGRSADANLLAAISAAHPARSPVVRRVLFTRSWHLPRIKSEGCFALTRFSRPSCPSGRRPPARSGSAGPSVAAAHDIADAAIGPEQRAVAAVRPRIASASSRSRGLRGVDREAFAGGALIHQERRRSGRAGQQPAADQLQSGAGEFGRRGRPSRSAWSAIAADARARCRALRRDGAPRPHRAGARPAHPAVKFWNAEGDAAAPRATQPAPPPAMNADQRRCDRAVDPFARLPHQPLDLEPLRHRFVGDGIVARMQRFRHRAPRLHPLGIVGMRREPASTSPRRSAGNSLST